MICRWGDEEKNPMRKTFAALSFAAFAGLVCCQSAAAVPASAPAMQAAAAAVAPAAPTHLAQYYERHTRHGVVKCYRELVVGRYVCRRYGWW
jgi:hypothetical protein